jgi:hypothetical protein
MLRVYQPSGRRPEGPTIPSALQRDLELQHNRMDSLIRFIRDRAPAASEAPQGPPAGDMENALGPVRWI